MCQTVNGPLLIHLSSQQRAPSNTLLSFSQILAGGGRGAWPVSRVEEKRTYVHTVFHFLLNDGATATSNRPMTSDDKEYFRGAFLSPGDCFVYRLICSYLPNWVCLFDCLFILCFKKTYSNLCDCFQGWFVTFTCASFVLICGLLWLFPRLQEKKVFSLFDWEDNVSYTLITDSIMLCQFQELLMVNKDWINDPFFFF